MATKLVNGIRVEMSPEEEAAFVASQAPRVPGPKELARLEMRALQADFMDVVAGLIGDSSPQEARDWKARLLAARATLKG